MHMNAVDSSKSVRKEKVRKEKVFILFLLFVFLAFFDFFYLTISEVHDPCCMFYNFQVMGNNDNRLAFLFMQFIQKFQNVVPGLSLIHISEPTRLGMISYAVFCLKKKKKK